MFRSRNWWPPVSTRLASPIAPAQARRILVVEDHEDTRMMLRLLLEMENFVVLEAEDGEAALNAAVQQVPDLILMDLSLPGVNGITATQLIRKHRLIAETPIIFLSGRSEPAQRAAAHAAGGNDFLVKPIDIDAMFKVMERWLAPRPQAQYKGCVT